MSKNKVSIQEKLAKDNPEFCAEVAGLSVEQINGRLAQLAQDREALNQAKEADEALEDARALSQELAAPYRDGKNAINQKSSYLVALLNEKGGA